MHTHVETEQSRANKVSALYRTGDSWIHRMHPLTKISTVPAITLVALTDRGFVVPLFFVVLLLIVAAATGVAGSIAKGLRIIVPIGIALFLVHAPFHSDNVTQLFAIGPIGIYQEGAEFALTIISRLAIVVVTVTMAFWTTHPKRLVSALMQKGLSHKICFSYLGGTELIPEMRRRATAILEAQQSRGFDTRGGLKQRALTLFALLKPLLVGALIAVETRSLALDSRGFSLPGKRTTTCTFRESRLDGVVRWLCMGVCVAAIAYMVVR